MSHVDIEMTELLSLLDCSGLHNIYYDTVTTICHDFTSSFFVLALFIGIHSLSIIAYHRPSTISYAL
jgi:hypothetical protein